MLDLGGVRDRPEFMRRLGITAALLIVYRLGTFTPLPGIDPEALSRLGGVAERISIFALGITPLITVLILAELLKVVAPGIRRWEQAAPRNRDKLNSIVVGLSLLAAAAQASGLALALEDVKDLVSEPGTPFRLTTIATLVGGSAIVIWLANQITRHGIGSGVWLLFVTPWLSDLIPHYAALAAWQREVGTFLTYLTVATAVVALVLAVIVKLLQAGGGAPATISTALWAVLLGNATWPWVIVALSPIIGGSAVHTGDLVAVLILAGLVALFANLYLRSQRLASTAEMPAIATAVLAGGLAIVTFMDMSLAMQLQGLVPLSGHLIIIAVVALSLLARWWQPPFETTGKTE